MDRGKAADPPKARRIAISRPRLIRVLERSEARVVALVAPAGYGKTTLAREWTSSPKRLGAWYRAGPGSSDVAALAAGLSNAISEIVPDAPADIHQRLKATRDPEADAPALGNMLVRHLAEWPANAWLVIDDYHYIARSAIAESFVERLSETQQLNLFLGARQRPSWVTPRKLIYGDILELSRSSLAMTPDEALEVVGPDRSVLVAGLLALAEGWPAVIGLAAHVEDVGFGESTQLPQNLHDFFAEELLQAAPDRLRDGLYQLALLGSPSQEVVNAIFPDLPDPVDQIERLGFVSTDGITVVMHPLLRTFFFGKLKREDPDLREAALREALSRLFSLQNWDEAFELIETFKATDQLAPLVEGAAYELLSSSRLPTVERWARLLRTYGLNQGLVDLMEAEVLFRRGHWAESERLGARGADNLSPDHALRSRAFFRAGQSAQFGDRLTDAIKYHERAKVAARTAADRSRALWGLFIAQSELERVKDALQSLKEFEASRTGSVEDEIRLIGSNLTRWVREKGIGRAHELEERAARFLDQPADPVVRCGFYQMLSITYSLAGDYRDALRVAEKELSEAQHNFLTFVVPHAYTNHALAYLGLRLFRNAESCLDAADQAALAQDDVHSQLNASAIRSRLLLALGRPRDAVQACEVSFERRPNPGMLADFLSSRALALACADAPSEALSVADEAAATSRLIETRVQCAAARAIVALRTNSDDLGEQLTELSQQTDSTGNVDGLISAYRGFPPLLKALASNGYTRLNRVVDLGHDRKLARKMGIFSGERERPSGLTRREQQVYELLRHGRTNREIAQALWITETTAKVHVRHILEKLGARSRTEAALKEVGTDLGGS